MSAVPARGRVRKATRRLPGLLDRHFEVHGLDLGGAVRVEGLGIYRRLGLPEDQVVANV